MNRLFFVSVCLISVLSTSCSTYHENSLIRSDATSFSLSKDARMLLDVELDTTVDYRGIFNYSDIDNGAGSMVYPGGSAEVFLVSIFTHAAVANGMNEGEKSAVRVESDKVLAPYLDYLDGIKNRDLMTNLGLIFKDNYGYTLTFDEGDIGTSDLVVVSRPVFYMTQDQKEVILKHVLLLKYKDKDDVLFKNVIEVASRKVDADMYEYWVDMHQLKDKSIDMYQRSLRMFIEDVKGVYDDTASIEKTYRYIQGGEKKYERGTLVKQECDFVTIRTLRGWLKSFYIEDSCSASRNN